MNYLLCHIVNICSTVADSGLLSVGVFHPGMNFMAHHTEG